MTSSFSLPVDESTFGYVTGRIIRSIGDTQMDLDEYPEAIAAVGTVTFTPKDRLKKTKNYSAIVGLEKIVTTLDNFGNVSLNGQLGVWLTVGVYMVSFDLKNGMSIAPFQIEVQSSNTKSNPLDLVNAAPYIPPAGLAIITFSLPPDVPDDSILVKKGNSFYGYPFSETKGWTQGEYTGQDVKKLSTGAWTVATDTIAASIIPPLPSTPKSAGTIVVYPATAYQAVIEHHTYRGEILTLTKQNNTWATDWVRTDGLYAQDRSMPKTFTELAVGDDLDNFTTDGLRLIARSSQVANSILNSPIPNAFHVDIQKVANFVWQTLETWSGTGSEQNVPQIFKRRQYVGTWGPWIQVMTSAIAVRSDWPTLKSGDNLDDFTAEGRWSAAVGVTANLMNCPEPSAAVRLTVESKNFVTQTLETNVSPSTSLTSTVTWKRRKSGITSGVWTPWYRLALEADTGWRVITSWENDGIPTGAPLPANITPRAIKGWVAVRRIGENGMFATQNVAFSGRASFGTTQIPSGMLPTRNPYVRGAFSYSDFSVGGYLAGWQTIQLGEAGKLIDGNGIVLNYFCNAAWPTTLPGTPL